MAGIRAVLARSRGNREGPAIDDNIERREEERRKLEVRRKMLADRSSVQGWRNG